LSATARRADDARASPRPPANARGNPDKRVSRRRRSRRRSRARSSARSA
jgi:hypothetical protein